MSVFLGRKPYVVFRGSAVVLKRKPEHAQQSERSSQYHLCSSNEKTRHHNKQADGHEKGPRGR
jgi:hypothetical protein